MADLSVSRNPLPAEPGLAAAVAMDNLEKTSKSTAINNDKTDIAISEATNGDAIDAASQKDKEAAAVEEDNLDNFFFPDGGFKAWISVFCQFVAHFWAIGISTSVGVFTDYFVGNAVFPGAQNTLLSWSATLMTVGLDLWGPLTGYLAERFSYRLLACTGAVLIAAGGIINSFAVAVWPLFLGSIVSGMGYSCVIAPALAIPTHWFHKRLAFAFGIGMSGAGVGGAITIPVTQALVDSIGWRWAYRTIAIAGGASCLVAGLLMMQRLPKRSHSAPIIDKTVFKNSGYWKLAAMAFLWIPPFFCPFLYVPQQISDLADMDLSNGISAALCLSLLNLFQALGQFVIGSLMPRLGSYNLLVLTSLLTFLLYIPAYLLAVGSSGAGILAVCIIMGLVIGPFPVIVSEVAADRFGQDAFASKITMIFFWFAPASFITGPILGSIADACSVFAPDGARLKTNWTWVVVFCGCSQALLTLVGVWLRVERTGWKLNVKI